MSTVQTVHFGIAVDGSLPGLPLSKAQGDLKANGDAKGSANISEFGVNVEVEFIIVNKTFYLKGVTGGYSPMPLSTASSIIDPSAILDPNRGVVQLMKTAKNPTTEAIESVNGHDAYRVAVTPDPAAITVAGAGLGRRHDRQDLDRHDHSSPVQGCVHGARIGLEQGRDRDHHADELQRARHRQCTLTPRPPARPRPPRRVRVAATPAVRPRVAGSPSESAASPSCSRQSTRTSWSASSCRS